MKSVLFFVWLLFVTTAHSESFSMSPYLKRCGGKIYSKCNESAINQKTVFEDARIFAEKSGKQLIAVFGADWCPACVVFDKLLMTDPDASQFHSKYVVVKLDGEQSSAKDLAKKLGIAFVGFPQAFLFSSTAEFQMQFFPSRSGSIKAILTALTNERLQLKEKPKEINKVILTTSLEKPIDLNLDYGSAYFFPNASLTFEKYINQGFAALHVFHYLDAFRSFKEAERSNPNSVLAYAGQIISILQFGISDEVQYFANEAYLAAISVTTKSKVSTRDRALLDFARALQVANTNEFKPVRGERIKSIYDAYEDFQAVDPRNYEARSLLSWLMLSVLSPRDVKVILEKIALSHPYSIGAQHYLLHLAEMDNDEKKASDYGMAIARLAPKSAHAQHMYGHTLPQQGRWKQALEYFKKADSIHHAWSEKNGFALNQDWHYSHNLDLMAAAYLGLGEIEKAKEAWKIAMNDDSRAVGHYASLVVLTEDSDPSLLKWLESYSRAGWGAIVDPLKVELGLRKENVETLRKITGPDKDLIYRQILSGVADAFSKSGRDERLSQQINTYFSSRFKSGGFDGWSNAYIQLLRLKRIATILSMDWLLAEIDTLSFAVQNGSLCSSATKSKSLVPCFSFFKKE